MTHLRVTCQLSYWITQCYLPPDTGERTPLNPSHALDLPALEGWKAELTLVVAGWLYTEMV